MEAQDQAGNTATDNNGGNCYSFTTLQIPDYFTELFTTFDLSNHTLKFSPTHPPISMPVVPRRSPVCLPIRRAGTTISSWTGSADDGNAQIALTGGQTVKLYGQSYSAFWVGHQRIHHLQQRGTRRTPSRTRRTLTSRASSALFQRPRCRPRELGELEATGRIVMVVTWLNVPHHNVSNTNTFQIEMFFDGNLAINYLAIADTDGLAGLSAGGGLPADFTASDLSALGACGPKPPTAE